MKKVLIILAFVCFVASAHAASSVSVPGDFATVRAAIAAVDDGGTITITNSATYAEPNLLIAKPLKIYAATGQSPVIKNDGTTNATFLRFTQTGDVRIGSLTGGRIQFVFVRGATGTQPGTQWVQLDHTTDSLIAFENIDILCTGTTGVTANIQSITQNQATNTMKKANVSWSYCTLDWGRQAAYLTGSQYGMCIGSTGYIGSTSQGGPKWTLDHVKIKNYNRSGIWQQTRDAELNMNYCEVGTYGERFGTATGNPWGGIVNNQAAARWVGRINNTIFRGPATYSGCNITAPGTSVTLSKTVFLNGYNINGTGAVGALQIGGAASTTAFNGRMYITADHCDFADMSVVGSNAAAIFRSATTANENTSITLTITNSNIYSVNNKPVNLLTWVAGRDVFNSSYNNVYGAGASAGYTAGTGDISYDPRYFDATGSDMRYYNNTLKTADAVGGPIGTNAGYADVIGGIVPGNPGVINRAHGWTVLK
ncbi:hypothetical protein LLG95_04425 [bacterium]|nr:hypothetical protein [bacterium]